MLEIIHTRPVQKIRAALFDFDGTISTLRCGWEEVMRPMMVECLLKCGGGDAQTLNRLVADYVDESTGIQTIFQMKWLAMQVEARGGHAEDPWAYKDEYNRRLMRSVEEKKRRLSRGEDAPARYLMAGAAEFLSALREGGVEIYVASGTDHPDLVAEAKALGVGAYFAEIAGAPPREENCSKERVLRELIKTRGLRGESLAVIGDGKVEIHLGHEAGALTLGLASDEIRRRGVNMAKRDKLIRAGADLISGDFLPTEELARAFGL